MLPFIAAGRDFFKLGEMCDSKSSSVLLNAKFLSVDIWVVQKFATQCLCFSCNFTGYCLHLQIKIVLVHLAKHNTVVALLFEISIFATPGDKSIIISSPRISLRLFASLDLLQSTCPFSLYKPCNSTELHILSVFAQTFETTTSTSTLLANLLEVTELLVPVLMFLSPVNVWQHVM